MSWRKLGQVFHLEEQKIRWIKSHAMIPTPLLLDDRIRVYFTGRDEQGHSRISFVDLDRQDPARILYVHDRPLLEVGKLGTFDDSGTLCTCAVQTENEVYLYYTAYNIRVTVPYSNSIGVALSRDGGVMFERMFEGPIVDRNMNEPYFTISPWVLREEGLWHMWYASGTGWIKVNDVPESLYVIKYAYSSDGIVWQRDNLTCIQPLTPHEANARPTVIKENGSYKMWFCYRGIQDFRDGSGSYRIGYAEGQSPVKWLRDDTKAGIEFAKDGWDSKMQAYPAIMTVDGNTYMFYNGNGFGATGFGCAIWE
jgi:hypothetical protein